MSALSTGLEPNGSRCFAGLGCQLPPGGGRTAADAYAGLEVGILPSPGPSPIVGVDERRELLAKTEKIRHDRNELSAQLKQGKPNSEQIEKGKLLKKELAALEDQLRTT